MRFLYFHQNYWETSHLDFDYMQIYLPAINSWNTEEKNNLLSGQSTWPSCQGGEKSGKAFLPNKALLNARPIVLRSGQARGGKERSKKSNLLDLDTPLLSSLIVGLKTRLATSRYCQTQLSNWFLVSLRNLRAIKVSSILFQFKNFNLYWTKSRNGLSWNCYIFSKAAKQISLRQFRYNAAA